MFATTRWTVVMQAATEDSSHGRPGLSEIVRRYWQPLYSFARQRGLPPSDAEDATQGFLSELIDGDLLRKADPARGKFRTFLLTAWKRYLIDESRKENADKRGGANKAVSLDSNYGETLYREASNLTADGEQVFDAVWAMNLLGEARQRLRSEYAGHDKLNVHDALAPFLVQTLDASQYAAVGLSMKMTAGAVKVAVHRLRQRFAKVVREVVSETVEDPRDIEEELTELLRVLSKAV